MGLEDDEQSLGPGRAPSSELAHWSLLGYEGEPFPGRAVLEGLGAGLDVTEEEILRFIGDRNTARKEKNWKRADEVRNELLNKGIVLEDTPSGTIWKLK